MRQQTVCACGSSRLEWSGPLHRGVAVAVGHYCVYFGSGEYCWGNPPWDPWGLLFEDTGDHPPGRLQDMRPMSVDEAAGELNPEEEEWAPTPPEELQLYLQELAYWSQPTTGRIPRFKFAYNDPALVTVDEINAALANVDALSSAERERLDQDLGDDQQRLLFWNFVSVLREAKARGGMWVS